MPLLLKAFPNLHPVHRPDPDSITLTQASMKQLSALLSAHFDGEVVNVEAVGPGDAYHFTFATEGHQEAALRNGVLLPGDKKQQIGLSRIDDPATRVPPFCSQCATYNAHRAGSLCSNPFRCLQCGDVGHTEKRQGLRAFCPYGLSHNEHRHPEEAFCIHCLQEGHRAGTPQCGFWEEATGQDARIRRRIADLYRADPHFEVSNLRQVPSALVDLVTPPASPDLFSPSPIRCPTERSWATSSQSKADKQRQDQNSS